MSLRRWPEGLVLVGVLLCLAAKCAVEEGASDAWLRGAFWATAVAGLAAVAPFRDRRRWLDGFRLALLLVGLVELPSVYGALGGDGFEYYAFARSPLLDRDLDFANDFAGLGASPPRTEAGEVTSRVPIGQGLVWAPVVAAAHAGALLAAALGAGVTPDGFSPLYAAAVTSATFVLGFAALFLIEAMLRPRVGRAGALACALALFYATPLHFYLVANPFMSHGTQAFAATLFVAAWLRARERGDSRSWLLAGLAGSLMSLVRAQDGVLLLPALLDALLDSRAGRLSRALRFVAAPAAAILAQTLVWRAMYGPDFVATVAWLNWVGGAEANVAGVLFSPRHGLFTWTPLFALSALGLLLLARRDVRGSLFALLACGLAVAVNANLVDWWGSDSFGQRRLLVLLPLLGIGLGEAVALVQSVPLLAVAAGFALFAGWNLQLEYIYNAELVAGKRDPVTLDRLAPAQVGVLYRSLVRAQGSWPASLWAVAYDNLSGIWLDDPPRSLGGRVEIGDEGEDPWFRPIGDGWFAPESEPGVKGYRRVRGRRASLRLPVRSLDDRVVVVRARADFDPPEPLELRLVWNGAASEGRRLTREWAELRFEVGAEAMRVGFNDVALLLSAAPRGSIAGFEGRNASAAVDWLRVERRSAAQ